MSLYCHLGHKNQPSSRFCHQCGAKLDLPASSSGIYPGRLLGDRYAVVSQLGQGGFGRTYLAEDTNRFRELCVLKEFSPQEQNQQILQKAEEMFEREAGVLYKLQHPQIPRFRELFRANLDGKGYLFLVQDYIEGQNYQELLEARQQQGMLFGEAEVMLLLLQILPVLEYIHSLGVIHRDISPDNIILRSADSLPVLIDFGGVKQVAATVASGFNQPTTTSPATLLGKAGYAPHEQIQWGTVYPHSDLYALAATVMALLTGMEPQELIDDRTLSWNWRQQVNLSPSLGNVLDQMLSQQLSDRYQSAREVLQALTNGNPIAGNSTTTTRSRNRTQATLALAPAPRHVLAASSSAIFSAAAAHKWGNGVLTRSRTWLRLLPIVGVVGLSLWFTTNWLQHQAEISSEPTASPLPSKPQFSAAEQQRKNRLRQQRQQLGISNRFYIALVNQAFWQQYPQERGRSLSVTAEDAQLRAEWDRTAAELLEQLQPLNPETRRQLGNYTAKSRERWQPTLDKLNVSSRALEDLANAAFGQMFSQQQGKNLINQPIGQVWYALAAEQLQAMTAGTAYEKIEIGDRQQMNGTFDPGEGKAYVAELDKDRRLQLKVEADPQVQISIYSPQGKILLENSGDRSWSGKLPESGFYEFVVVSTATNRQDYQLDLAVEDSD